jgi:hypothetical protein
MLVRIAHPEAIAENQQAWRREWWLRRNSPHACGHAYWDAPQ